MLQCCWFVWCWWRKYIWPVGSFGVGGAGISGVGLGWPARSAICLARSEHNPTRCVMGRVTPEPRRVGSSTPPTRTAPGPRLLRHGRSKARSGRRHDPCNDGCVVPGPEYQPGVSAQLDPFSIHVMLGPGSNGPLARYRCKCVGSRLESKGRPLVRRWPTVQQARSWPVSQQPVK
jgi:hypothetical protein